MPIVENTGNAMLPKMINLVSAVGRGCTNQPDDVKFVQLALREIFGSSNWQQMMRNQPLTGVADETTIAWIWLFQNLIKRMGSPVVADQRVDRAHGLLGPAQHKIYTIFHLNHQFAQANPGKFNSMLGG